MHCSLKGCVAHGETQDAALKEVSLLANEWMEIVKENGCDIPVPKGRLMYA